jgi:hypothetical protein
MLENLKNNVDTILYDEPELGHPDMTAKSGVTPASAGTPKLSMKTGAATSPPAPPPPHVFSPVEPESVAASPFEAAAFAPAVVAEPDADEDPFGAVHVEPFTEEAHESPFAVAVMETEPDAADNPFGTTNESADRGAQRFELEEMLASARAVTVSLEDALSRSREHERVLQEHLGRL